MVGSTNSKLALAIGDPDRDSLALFSCFPHSAFNLQSLTSFFSTFQLSNLQTRQRSLTYPLSFQSLPHSFAPSKISTLLFSSNSKLFCKNTRGGGVGCCRLSTRSNSQALSSRCSPAHPGGIIHKEGATRFRRKLSRPEGMPGPTCPQLGGN
jgi:hypothetical protein